MQTPGMCIEYLINGSVNVWLLPIMKSVGLEMPKNLDELNRRSQVAETRAMRRYTFWITLMTAVITVATIANLGIAFVLFRKP